jgi:glyoxylase-like metal-dependent hydrolase (beta-lactamase superfamily II)
LSVTFAHRWHDELFANLGDDLPVGWPDPLLGIRALDGDVVPDAFAGERDEEVRFVVHDGHAPGHTAVWLPERGVLVAGDMLSDIELPLPFSPDDLGAYLAGLDTLAPVVSLARVLVPGHGHATDRPLDRLDADRRYLDDVLHGRDPDDPRRGLAGMEDAHRKIVALARAHRT